MSNLLRTSFGKRVISFAIYLSLSLAFQAGLASLAGKQVRLAFPSLSGQAFLLRVSSLSDRSHGTESGEASTRHKLEPAGHPILKSDQC